MSQSINQNKTIAVQLNQLPARLQADLEEIQAWQQTIKNYQEAQGGTASMNAENQANATPEVALLQTRINELQETLNVQIANANRYRRWYMETHQKLTETEAKLQNTQLWNDFLLKLADSNGFSMDALLQQLFKHLHPTQVLPNGIQLQQLPDKLTQWNRPL